MVPHVAGGKRAARVTLVCDEEVATYRLSHSNPRADMNEEFWQDGLRRANFVFSFRPIQ